LTFLKTTESYQQGARTMPGRYYTEPRILAEEADRVFARSWICVGRAADLPNAGDYRLAEVAGESLIVLRDQARGLHAFYNVCRHRGTRLCEGAQGCFSETLQCQYHAWTYGLDGRLIGAPHMHEVEGFDKWDYPLHRVPLEAWEGFLFVNLAREPGSFADAFAPVSGRFARYGLAGLTSARRIEYRVKANWELIMQNYSECLHCPTIHRSCRPSCRTPAGRTTSPRGRSRAGTWRSMRQTKAPR
jgi:Rieske 2Fe-2S family protein